MRHKTHDTNNFLALKVMAGKTFRGHSNITFWQFKNLDIRKSDWHPDANPVQAIMCAETMSQQGYAWSIERQPNEHETYVAKLTDIVTGELFSVEEHSFCAALCGVIEFVWEKINKRLKNHTESEA